MKQSCYYCRFCHSKDDYPRDRAPLGICSFTGCAVRYYEEGDNCTLYRPEVQGLWTVLKWHRFSGHAHDGERGLPDRGELVVVFMHRLNGVHVPVLARRSDNNSGDYGTWILECGESDSEISHYINVGDLWAKFPEDAPDESDVADEAEYGN